MSADQSVTDTIIQRLKRHKVIGVLIAIESIAIGISAFSGAARNLLTLIMPERPADARAELARLSIAYTPEAFVQRAAQGDLIAVKLLLKAGMDPNAVDEKRNTFALFEAAEKGHASVVAQLLEANADVNMYSSYWTPLVAAVAAGNVEILTALLRKGCTPAAINLAFDVAAQRGRADILSLLRTHGASEAKLINEALRSAINSSVGSGADLVRSVNLLLDFGADLNYLDQQGWTPLHHAAYRSQHLEIIDLLISRGADVNARDPDGATPLWWAAGVGRREAAKILLARGARVDLTDKDGKSANDRARFNRDSAMLDLLRNAGSRATEGKPAR